jgi:3-oxoacyl-[acyl-carrier-protein] synthase II
VTELKRVAVTGMGVKAPGGTSLSMLESTMLSGRTVAEPIAEFAEHGLPVTFGVRVPPFDTQPYLSPRELRQLSRVPMLALTAAMDAVADAGLSIGEPDRVGVAVGAGAGGISVTEDIVTAHHADFSRVPVLSVTHTMANAAAGRISIQLGARGAAMTYAMACASGTVALGEAMRKIRYGELDVVIAGGAEAPLSFSVVGGFARLGALSTRNDDPGQASRPFDQDRDGFVLGEGAAFLVLERWSHAEARGARIYGELAGYGANSDAHHVVSPREDGSSAATCMMRAIRDARLMPADIGHINAHGTATQQNDEAEARAIRASFGDSGPPVTAPKGVLGHSLGASGAVEAVIALTAARSGRIPPVANFVAGKENTGLIDVVAGTPRIVPKAPVISNSFAFGGHNASVVFIPC